MADARIAVVGAGTAGLVTAAAAAKLGLDVTVFDAAPDLVAAHGGILLHPNGRRVLDALGVTPALQQHLRAVERVSLELPGAPVGKTDYSQLDVLRYRAHAVLRVRLLEALAQAVRGAGGRVALAHECTAITVHDDQAILHFASGAVHRADVVVAGDGPGSAVRTMVGLRGRVRPLGKSYLRGVARVGTLDSTVREIWGTDGRRLGVVPLPGEQTGFFCSVPSGTWPDARDHHREEWLQGWASFGADLPELLRAVDWDHVACEEQFDIRLARWWKLPAFLVGDAAHAMSPSLAQGANSGMVDGLVLARLLAQAFHDGDDLTAVGHAYDALRRPFVSRVQALAQGTDLVAGLSSPAARWLRDRVLTRLQGMDLIKRASLQLFAGHHPEEQPFFAPL